MLLSFICRNGIVNFGNHENDNRFQDDSRGLSIYNFVNFCHKTSVRMSFWSLWFVLQLLFYAFCCYEVIYIFCWILSFDLEQQKTHHLRFFYYHEKIIKIGWGENYFQTFLTLYSCLSIYNFLSHECITWNLLQVVVNIWAINEYFCCWR